MIKKGKNEFYNCIAIITKWRKLENNKTKVISKQIKMLN